MSDLVTNIRAAIRLLARDRAFTVTAIVALALGIAANNTVFTLGNGVFLRDLPFEFPDRIVAITTQTVTASRNPYDNLSFPDFQDLRASATVFDDIGVVDEVAMNISDDERAAERFFGSYMSANGFQIIGRRPALGRDFTADDDRVGAPAVVILGDVVWRNRYGADPGLIGRTIRVNGVPSTVIGVMPAGFGFPTQSALWQPMGVRAGAARNDRGIRNIDGFGRMVQGVTIEQASADLGRVMQRLANDYPATNRNIGPRVRPFRDTNTGGPVRVMFSALMGSVAFLLLIACANVGNLLLARGTARAREISVRLSLGATRWQIVRQLLIESLVLAVVAGVLGWLLALGGVRAVDAGIRGTGEPYWLQFPMDARVFLFVAGVCLVTTVLFGLVPALHASKAGLVHGLHEAARGATASQRSRRWTGGLVIVQLALTIVLLAGAGLMIRNVLALSRVDAGVDTSGLLTMRLALPNPTYPTPERRRLFLEQLDERLAGLPGVRAGIGTWAPLGGAYSRTVSIEGLSPDAGVQRPRVSSIAIGTSYFDALGVEPLRGRMLTRADGTSGPAAAIVNQAFAAAHFPAGDALGRRIGLDSAGSDLPATGWLTIVGIVPNIRHEEADPRLTEAVVYVPFANAPLSFAAVVASSNLDRGAVIAAIRSAVAELDRDLPLFDIMTAGAAFAINLQPFRVFGSLFVVFAAAALLLATVGLYGVTAYAVTQRTRELGVRMALGAGAASIWWSVTRRAAFQLTLGAAIGIVGALGLGQVLQSVLSGVSGRDAVTMIGVPVLLVLIGVAACLGPARRAMRLDPASVLRSE